MKILIVLALLFLSQNTFANNCGDTSDVREKAIRISKFQAKQAALLIGGQPSQFEVSKYTSVTTNYNDPDYFDTIVAKIEVVGKKHFGNEVRELIRVQLELIDDVRHSCELQVAKIEVTSAYRICREVNGYNGRIGNAYDPCVE